MTRHKYDVDWHSLFLYDETSPSCLRWKITRGSRAIIGGVVGSINKENKYWYVNLLGSNYLVHRVIVVLHGQGCDGLEVDHIDRNKSNNTISNLRVVTRPTNGRNLPKQVINTSGVCGVTLYEKVNPNGNVYLHFTSKWYDLNGKRRSKNFSVAKYGYDKAFQLSCEYRAKMIAELNLQGAGYTETHGK